VRSLRARRVVLVVVVLAYVVGTIVARARGYKVGGNTPVRCGSGHVYTTIWVPGASLKSVRLGWKRLQWCPVGGHWSWVTPQRLEDLTPDERLSAEHYRDVRIP
jgi:hypothetical protein